MASPEKSLEPEDHGLAYRVTDAQVYASSAGFAETEGECQWLTSLVAFYEVLGSSGSLVA